VKGELITTGPEKLPDLVPITQITAFEDKYSTETFPEKREAYAGMSFTDALKAKREALE
jgi:hypothetical protein